ncbi:cell envelope integrity EipB family protein [uncultured Enterovirga sp.]|uniref:cell envelope integrity EipB family protein n=1 Tax=uncultured Enterovirga sp. TaxID=2026352 RepID=UPI0035CB5453
MQIRFVTKLALSMAASLLVQPRPARSADAPVRLAPHRVVYDLTLLSSRGTRGVESARGRIVFDLTGNACEGYNLKFRQVMVVEGSESGSKTSDFRTAHFESGDGRLFRFRSDNTTGEGAKTSVDGNAERRPGGLTLRLRVPKRQSLSLDNEAVFPNTQMRDLITAGREGRKLVPMKVYDGSDDGQKVYETLGVVGDRLAPKPEDEFEEAARKSELTKLARWPVTLSYFTQARGDQSPVYVLSFELYENGISRALKLDYGDFALRGEMVRLDLLPDSRTCPR